MGLLGFLDQCRRWFTDLTPAPRATGEAGVDEPTSENSPAGVLEEADESVALEDAWWHPAVQASASTGGDSPTMVDAALYDKVTEALDDPGLELPQVRQVTQRALVMLRSDDVSYPALAKVVRQDPVLTAEMLKVANSVMFGGVNKVTALDRAFGRLGQRELKRILLTTSMKSIAIQAGGTAAGLGQELWHAAVASAALLEHLAGRYGLAKDEAFLIGLLHDIGQLVVLKVVHEFSSKSKTKVTRPTFDQLCANWHEHLGMRLAGHWSLPDPLPEIIGHHHGEIASNHPLATQLRLVELSDVVCSLLGYRPFEPCEFFELECVRELGLVDEPETHQLLLDVPELLDHATRVYA